MAAPKAPQPGMHVSMPRPEMSVKQYTPRETTRFHGAARDTFVELASLLPRLHSGPPTTMSEKVHWYAHGPTALALKRHRMVDSAADLHIALHLEWDAWEHQAEDITRQLEIWGMEPVERATANGNLSRLTVADMLNGGKLIHLDAFYAGYEPAHMVQFHEDGYLAIPGWLVADAMPCVYDGFRVPLPDRIERYLAAYYGPRWQTLEPAGFDLRQSPLWQEYGV